MTTDPTPFTQFGGKLRLAEDATSPAIAATVAISDDGRLRVSAAGTTIADWPLNDVEITQDSQTTILRNGPDALEFEATDSDAWAQQIAALRIRNRMANTATATLSQAPLPVRATPVDPSVSQFGYPVGTPAVHVAQSTSVMTPRRVTHWLHFLLSIFTLGFWIPVWIAVSIYTGSANARAARSSQHVHQGYRPATVAQPPRTSESVRSSNRSLFKTVGIGLAVIVVLGTLLSLAADVSNASDGQATPIADSADASETTSTTSVKAPAPKPATDPRGPEAPDGDYVTGMRLTALRAAERSPNGALLSGSMWEVYYTESCVDLDIMSANADGLGNENAREHLSRAVRWQQDYLGC